MEKRIFVRVSDEDVNSIKYIGSKIWTEVSYVEKEKYKCLVEKMGALVCMAIRNSD